MGPFETISYFGDSIWRYKINTLYLTEPFVFLNVTFITWSIPIHVCEVVQHETEETGEL